MSVWFLVLLHGAAIAGAQTFEVASIKANTSDSIRTNLDLQPGGRFVATNVSLMALIGVAYGEGGRPLPPNRLVIKDKWVGGTRGAGYTSADRYDIVAKAEGELTLEQLPAALRRLLEDRFKLTVHRETKELPVYQLMLAQADASLGPKLKRSSVAVHSLT